MATVDLGKISFTQKGTWNSGTAYVAKDIVQYEDDREISSYVAVASSTNQAPATNGTVNTTYWVLFAKGVSVASNNQGTYNPATAYQKGDTVQYTDTGVLSTYLAIADSTGQTPSTAGTINSSYWSYLAKGTASVGLAWQSTIVTGSTLSATAGNGYWIDTTSNACTITLPATASVGDQIIFSDYKRTWGTNAVTLNTNSLNFQGNPTSGSGSYPIYNTDGQSVSIIYSGATQGWIPTVDDDVSYETQQSYTADFLVIAGGGGGGGTGTSNAGGGGGAGGYRNSYSTEASGGGGSSETSLTFTPGTVYTITVGAGGASRTTGNNSSISGTGITTITSSGGGRGGDESSSNDAPGGSGGGAGKNSNQAGGAGTANQGFDGGGSNDSGSTGGGGGGGASAVGGTGTSPNELAGNGGNGLASSITGSSVTRGGGGGGGTNDNSGTYTVGSGGSGGGASGGGGTGTANTGGGGGGGNHTTSAGGGAGGSGVVILRMATADYTGTTTGSPSVSTSGSDTILVFNSSGSYTA